VAAQRASARGAAAAITLRSAATPTRMEKSVRCGGGGGVYQV
jgi:hypothetical protein